MLVFAKRGGVIYIGSPIDRNSLDEKALLALNEIKPDCIIDEALESLKRQVVENVEGPFDFESAVINAMTEHEVDDEKVIFMAADDENTVAFHAPYRASKTHTLKWCVDNTIELDGAIIRRTALMGCGHLKTEVLGGGILSPEGVVGFIANRMALCGVDDLIGYGRAFGPGKEDHTNATLTPKGRIFRAHGIVGVVGVSTTCVSKAKPDMVIEVALALFEVFKATLTEITDAVERKEFIRKNAIFLHQQCVELYQGECAMEAFRAVVEDDDRITLGGKSTKHARVDAGAYCLYTASGDGTITMPAVIGNFEVSNDGSIYAPLDLMQQISGYLKETVKAVRDFSNMSEELLARYYNAEVVVREGDRIEPGDTVFTIDGVPHTWNTKADFGIVRNVVDTISTKLVHCEVCIDAYFEGDLKMRGFGKGLVCPAEAAGITCSVPDAFIIGAAGIIKDSNAANERISNITRQSVSITVEYCSRDFELAIAKHNPNPSDWCKDILEKHYEGLCSMEFNLTDRTVTITDPNAIVCDITFMIEASPVGQSVGTSAMTLPQMSFLSSLPVANQWLCDQALPGIIARTNALAYLHTVAGYIPIEL